jgi:hypothetical protein
LLKKVFLKLYPQSEDRWNREIDSVQPQERASAFVALLKSKKTRKGDFTQQLAEFVENGEAFIVPGYLDQAIRKVAEE